VRRSDPGVDIERGLLAKSSAQIVIAIDEVGRGALAGPVTLGAVAIDAHTGGAPAGVRDSKALSAKRREFLVPAIHEWARASAVVDIPASRIDHVGIVQALGEGAAAVAAIVALACADAPAVVLLDGHHDFLTPVNDTWQVHTVVKGDASCASIAGASIIAKVHRDAVMRDLHHEHMAYGWDRNAGYGTTEHRRALQEHGVTSYHRTTWRLMSIPNH